jgi:hypothetical protein
MALHPGEAGYDEDKLRARKEYNRTDWPGSNSFHPAHLQTAPDIYSLSDEIKELEKQAAKSCLCDGGNTLCRACVAEKHLKELRNNPSMMTGKKIAVAPIGTMAAHAEITVTYTGGEQHKIRLAHVSEIELHNGLKETTSADGLYREFEASDEITIKLAGIRDNTPPPVKEEKPRLPVGVSVLLTDSMGRLLLGRRKNNSGAGLLSTPGGRLEVSENVLQCARREFKEETGADLELDNLRIIGVKELFRF